VSATQSKFALDLPRTAKLYACIQCALIVERSAAVLSCGPGNMTVGLFKDRTTPVKSSLRAATPCYTAEERLNLPLIALCLLGWAKIGRDKFVWSAVIGQQGISAEYHEKSAFALAASTPHCKLHCLGSGTRIQLAACAPLSAETDLFTFRFVGSPRAEL
jgi:hypothetical protein